MDKPDAISLRIENTPHITIGKGGQELLDAAIKRGNQNSKLQSEDRTFAAFAAPMVWGPDITIASHIGSVTYVISYEAVGDTLVSGRVTYYKGIGGGQKVTEEFRDETTITTANAVANVVCDFKGVPTGSAVNVTVTP